MNETDQAETDVPAPADSNGCLTANQILLSDDLVIQRIELPEWGKGAYAYVRTMPSEEKDDWEDCLARKKDGSASFQNMRAKFAVLILCDAEGAPIFGPEHLAPLGKKSTKALARIYDTGLQLNGTSDEDIKELAGN